MLELFHLALTVCSFIIYEFFFTYQLIHYLNGYIESSHKLAKEVKKYGLEVEMLKRAKEKAEKEVGEVFMKADATERRAEDAKAVFRKAVEENFRLLGKIAKFEAQAKRNTAASEENFHLQKKIRELKARLGVEEK